ncbi:unnamed protein product, partial [Sphenostylis stenocarpa]
QEHILLEPLNHFTNTRLKTNPIVYVLDEMPDQQIEKHYLCQLSVPTVEGGMELMNVDEGRNSDVVEEGWVMDGRRLGSLKKGAAGRTL